MAACHHGRDQIDYVKMGAKRTAPSPRLHVKIVADMGATHTLLTPFIRASARS